MKRTSYLWLVAVLLFSACNQDDDQANSEGRIFTDAHIDAPVVDCEDAFNLFQFTDNTGSPTNRRIDGLTFNNEGIGLAIDEDRNLWRVTDDGLTWARINFPLGNTRTGQPGFAGNETVYLVQGNVTNSRARLLRSDDRGESFRLLDDASWQTIFDKSFTSADEGYLLVNDPTPLQPENYKLIATTNGGASWTDQVLPVDLNVSPNFVKVNEQLGIDAGTRLLVQGTDGTWEVRPYPQSSRVVRFNGNVGIRLSSEEQTELGDKLYRTDDGGRSWTTDDLPYQYPDYLEIFDDGSALMITRRFEIIGGDALSFRGLLVYESNDGGATWEVLKTNNRCGLGRTMFTTPTGKRVSVGQDKIVVLER